MNFETKKIYPQGSDVRYSYQPQKAKYSFSFKGQDKEKLKKRVLGIGTAILLIFAFWLTKNVVQDLPDVSSINNMVFSEATVIEDRN
jgi:hypothetical protein